MTVVEFVLGLVVFVSVVGGFFYWYFLRIWKRAADILTQSLEREITLNKITYRLTLQNAWEVYFEDREKIYLGEYLGKFNRDGTSDIPRGPWRDLISAHLRKIKAENDARRVVQGLRDENRSDDQLQKIRESFKEFLKQNL